MNQEDGGTRSTRPTLLHWSHHWSHPSSPKHRIGKTTMAEPAQGKPQPPPAVPGPAAAPAPRRRHSFHALRAEIPAWQGVAMGILCIVVCLGTVVVADRRRREPLAHHRSRDIAKSCDHVRGLPDLMVRTGADSQSVGEPQAGRAGVRLGGGCGRAAGGRLRLLPADQRVLRPAGDHRPQRPGGSRHPLDVRPLRHRRVPEGDVHLHRLRGLHRDGHGQFDRRGRLALRRYGLHPGRRPLANHPQGPRAALHARHFQLAEALVRPGLRLHHAGGADQVRGRGGRSGRHHQRLAATPAVG